MGLLNQDQWSALGLLGAGIANRNFSGGTMAAMQHLDGAEDRRRKGLLADLQLQKLQSEMDDAKSLRDWRTNLPSPEFLAGQTALTGGGGPTAANAARIPAVSPIQSLLHGGLRAGAVKPEDYLKAFQPKELPFSKVDPKDYTPESIQAFAAAGGDYTKLVPVRKREFVNGTAVDPYETKPGTVIPKPFDPNQPFNMVGGQVTPNTPFQTFSMQRATASAPKIRMPAIDLRDPTALYKAGVDLQDRVRAAFAPDQVIASQYNAMLNAMKDPSPQGDTALLYSFFKVLDPASTVREGEIAMVKDNRSIPARIKAYAQKLAGGGSLLPAERADIVAQAQRQIEGRRPRTAKDVQAYRENAQRINLDPNLYVPDPYEGIPSVGAAGTQSGSTMQNAAREELKRRGLVK